MQKKTWAAPTVTPLAAAKDARLGGGTVNDAVLVRRAAGS